MILRQNKVQRIVNNLLDTVEDEYIESFISKEYLRPDINLNNTTYIVNIIIIYDNAYYLVNV